MDGRKDLGFCAKWRRCSWLAIELSFLILMVGDGDVIHRMTGKIATCQVNRMLYRSYRSNNVKPNSNKIRIDMFTSISHFWIQSNGNIVARLGGIHTTIGIRLFHFRNMLLCVLLCCLDLKTLFFRIWLTKGWDYKYLYKEFKYKYGF